VASSSEGVGGRPWRSASSRRAPSAAAGFAGTMLAERTIVPLSAVGQPYRVRAWLNAHSSA